MMSNRLNQLTEVESSQTQSAVVAPPCAMVIFGAAGDLTKRLVVPALYNLANAKRLSDEFPARRRRPGRPRPPTNGVKV